MTRLTEFLIDLVDPADIPFPLALLCKLTLVLGVSWLLHAALPLANPRWRVLLWRSTVVGLALLPFSMWLVPGLEFPLRVGQLPAASELPAREDHRATIPAQPIPGTTPPA